MLLQNEIYRTGIKLFSKGLFRSIIYKHDSEKFQTILERFNNIIPISDCTNNGDAIKKIYNSYKKHYRFEYLYKNIIINEILIGRYSLENSTLINEIKIGNSIADLLIINGKPIIYEIKSELDNPIRLETQILDYKKCFPEIYIATHESLEEYYLKFAKKYSIGLLVLNANFKLEEKLYPIVDFSEIENGYLFRVLRKSEYSEIIQNHFGSIPNVPATSYYRECQSLFTKIDSILLYEYVYNILKKRKLKEPRKLLSTKTPKELRLICYCLDLSKSEYDNLYAFLKSPTKYI